MLKNGAADSPGYTLILQVKIKGEIAIIRIDAIGNILSSLPLHDGLIILRIVEFLKVEIIARSASILSLFMNLPLYSASLATSHSSSFFCSCVIFRKKLSWRRAPP